MSAAMAIILATAMAVPGSKPEKITGETVWPASSDEHHPLILHCVKPRK